MDIQISGVTIANFALYTLVLGFVLAQRRPHKSFLLLGLVALLSLTAWTSGLLKEVGLVAIGLLWLTSFLTTHHHHQVRKTAWVALVLGALAFAFHAVPGFNNPLLFGPETIGRSELPYTLYANLDKGLAGVLLLAAFRPHIRMRKALQAVRSDAPFILLGLIIIFAIGVLLGVRFEPKFGELTLAFIFFNLLVTCLAEEGFFRLVVQDGLQKRIKHPYRGEIAMVVSVLVFTLAHFHTGPGAAERLLLIGLAGGLYAWIYQRHRSFISAVLAHFSVNVVHLSLFTYPATF